jgi:hypothetical protein
MSTVVAKVVKTFGISEFPLRFAIGESMPELASSATMAAETLGEFRYCWIRRLSFTQR